LPCRADCGPLRPVQPAAPRGTGLCAGADGRVTTGALPQVLCRTNGMAPQHPPLCTHRTAERPQSHRSRRSRTAAAAAALPAERRTRRSAVRCRPCTARRARKAPRLRHSYWRPGPAPLHCSRSRRRHRSRPLADPEQRRGPNRKLEAVRQHSPPSLFLAPSVAQSPRPWGSQPFPLGRCGGESTHTHSCGTRHRRRSGSHRYFFRSASVPHSARSPSARHSQRGLPSSLTTTISLRGAPLPSPSLPLPRSFPAALLSFPFISFPFAPSSQSHFVEVGKPSARCGREPRPAPRGRGQGSGLSPESSSFLHNNSPPLRRESDDCR